MRGRAAGGEAKADARAGAAGRRAIARTRSGRSLRSARMMRTRNAGLRKREALARRFRRDRIDQAMCDLRFGLLSFDPQLAKRTQRTDASCGPSRAAAACDSLSALRPGAAAGCRAIARICSRGRTCGGAATQNPVSTRAPAGCHTYARTVSRIEAREGAATK